MDKRKKEIELLTEEVHKALEIEEMGEHKILPCALCKNRDIEVEKCFNGKPCDNCPLYNAYTYGDSTTYLFDPSKI